LGLIGTVAGGFMKFKTMKEMNVHQQRMVELESAALVQEAEMNQRMTEIQVEGALSIAEAEAAQQALSGSYKEATSRWSSASTGFANIALVFVDVVRGLTRPVLTFYLIWNANRTLERMTTVTDGITDPLLMYIAQANVLMASTSVTWWFGDRAVNKFLTRKFA
jgi:hypothetical protein